MNRPRVLVTGGSGFVGGAVVPLLRSSGARVRLLAHRRPLVRGPGVEVVDGDLTDPATLRGICRDVDCVLHLASHVGRDEASGVAVNTDGTRHLVAEAGRAGVGKFVRLGTAAVYGNGPFREAAEGAVEPRPVSPTSRSRLSGERFVLEAGGAVLRPYLVYGTGDRWVMPSLLRMLRALRSGLPGHGSALLSLTEVGSLATSLARMAVTTPPRRAAGVFHACPPRPVSLRELVVATHRHLGFPLVTGGQPLERARAEMVAAGGDGHLLDLFGVDHWFDATRLRTVGDHAPETGLSAGLAAHAAWYREQLT
ncbi:MULTISPECIES: NAD-dependent epimerase/dehydratase family protein [Streptomyces]|uniref:NAD-dependent epimerase/dehydratase family protein n=2 Tax=Streptomyces TaxID=1883 RepID=A0ABW7TBI7_9ACTN|nr:NAD-dependent epimerase/dehydratase family protein [Streptomyces luteoverticillatus]